MDAAKGTALNQLARAESIRNKDRWMRGLLLLPKYAQYRLPPLSKKPRPVSIPTFWGGRFDGVLPERVTSAIARYSLFDPTLCRTMLTLVDPGDTVIDIGAHFGFFSLLGSWLVGDSGRVIAIEAIPSTYEQLAANVRRNARYDNVTVVNCAAGDRAGTLEFRDFGLEFSSLNTAFEVRGPNATAAAERAKSIEVVMRTVDDVCAAENVTSVSFVKIDAESSEHLVVAGFQQILNQGTTLLSIEVSDDNAEEAAHTARVVDALAQLDYRPYRVSAAGLHRVAPGEPVGYANFLFARDDHPRLSRLSIV